METETSDIKTVEYYDPEDENLLKLNNNSYYGLEKYYYHPKSNRQFKKE